MLEIVPGLFLGNRESARDRRRLLQFGITHIVNCAIELPAYHPNDFTYLHLRLHDPDPGLEEMLDDLCTYLHEVRNTGKVLVHCFAGISRSPAVVLAYLTHLHQGDVFQAARQLGECVWTDPDLQFLAQIMRHHGLEHQETDLVRLSLVLQSRTEVL